MKPSFSGERSEHPPTCSNLSALLFSIRCSDCFLADSQFLSNVYRNCSRWSKKRFELQLYRVLELIKERATKKRGRQREEVDDGEGEASECFFFLHHLVTYLHIFVVSSLEEHH